MAVAKGCFKLVCKGSQFFISGERNFFLNAFDFRFACCNTDANELDGLLLAPLACSRNGSKNSWPTIHHKPVSE